MTTAVLSRNDKAYSGRPSSHEQANKPFYATWPMAMRHAKILLR